MPAHSSYDRFSLSSKNYEPLAFYRKHLWWFSTFRTKNIHISCLFLPAHSHLERRIYTCLVCLILPAHSIYDRYSLLRKNYEPLAFYRKHFWCFPHLERKIYTYFVFFCQRTLATIDIPLGARIMSRRRFIGSISGGFPHLEQRIYTYRVCFCLFLPAHSSIFLFEHASYRKHFWCFSTFRTKNIHISCLFLPAHSHLERRIYKSCLFLPVHSS